MALVFLTTIIIVIVIHTSLSCPYHNPPRIVSTLPHMQILNFGSNNSIVMECTAEGEPLPSYQWFKNHLPLTGDSPGPGMQVVTSAGGSRLEVNSPGYYHCQAGNSHGLAKSDVVHVTGRLARSERGTVVPTWTVDPETEVASVGSRVVLTCEAGGVPEPAVEWSKNAEVMQRETENRLAIDNLSENDVANYACNASNTAGYIYKNVIINLLTEGAKITRRPKKDQIVSKGSIVTIHCESEGYPKPRVSWKINGTEIEDSNKYKVNAETGSLTVMHVEMTDEGTYECTAMNHEEDQASGNLIIKSIIAITEGPKDQNVVVFSSILMNCSVVVDMTQNLTVMWKKNNVDLGLVGFSKSERIATDENYALRIKNVTFDDSGTYTCKAETLTSRATASGQLTILGIPPLLAQPNWPADQLEGSVITLPCPILKGYPAPQIVWYKDGHDIPMDKTKTYTDQDHSLRISTAHQNHSGDYTCRAHNSEGSDSLLIPLRVRRKSRIVSPQLYYGFEEGQVVIFNCEADVDEDLLDSLEIRWFKGEERLNVSSSHSNQTSLETSTHQDSNRSEAYLAMLPNSSLIISGVQHSDLGQYSCELHTSLEPVVRSEQSEIFRPEPQLLPLVIILVVILAITVLLLGICLTCHRMGYYRVHHAKTSNIFFTTTEKNSIITKVNRFPMDSFSPPITKSTIFTKIPMKQFSNNNPSAGSEGSLLSFEELLNSGMGEEGSFRGNYSA